MSESRTLNARIETQPGKTLYFDKIQADITISGTNKNEINVEAVIEINDMPTDLREEYFKNCYG